MIQIENAKILAEFLGYTYYPFNNNEGENPGWHKPSWFENKYGKRVNLGKITEKIQDWYLCRDHNTLLYKFKTDWNLAMKVYRELQKEYFVTDYGSVKCALLTGELDLFLKELVEVIKNNGK